MRAARHFNEFDGQAAEGIYIFVGNVIPVDIVVRPDQISDEAQLSDACVDIPRRARLRGAELLHCSTFISLVVLPSSASSV